MSPKSRVSTLNPNPREMLSSMMPDARPSWRNNATAASPEIFVERIALVIPIDPRMTTIAKAYWTNRSESRLRNTSRVVGMVHQLHWVTVGGRDYGTRGELGSGP